MTDTAKPMWKRCDGCKARIFNEAVDIAAHRQNCPADLARRIQKLELRLKELIEQVDGIDGDVGDVTGLLAIDPNAVDETGFGNDDEDGFAADTDDADAFDIAQARTDAEAALTPGLATIPTIA